VKQVLFKLLIPGNIRRQLYKYYKRQIVNEEIENLRRIEETLPHVDLSPIYIANLRVVIDKFALLNALPRSSVVAEIGAQEGDFSSQIISISRPAKLYLIDSWPSDFSAVMDIVANKFRSETNLGIVTIKRGPSIEVLSGFGDGYFDWVFLNASRAYECLSAELEICRMKVKENGLISGCGYTIGSWPDRHRYGVIDAVNEFCKRNKWEFVYLTHEYDRNLSYAIRKMRD